MHWTSKAAVLQMRSRINRSIIPWERLRNENPPADPRSTEPATTRGYWAICVLTSPPRYIDARKFENPGAVPVFFHYSLPLLILVQHPYCNKHSATAPETLNLTGEPPIEKVRMLWESIYSLLVPSIHSLSHYKTTHIQSQIKVSMLSTSNSRRQNLPVFQKLNLKRMEQCQETYFQQTRIMAPWAVSNQYPLKRGLKRQSEQT